MEELKKFFKGRREVIAAYLFGSRAEGFERKESDYDIAILLDEKALQIDLFGYRLRMMSELSDFLKKDVELIILNNAPLFLASQIISKGKILHDKDPDKRAFFEMKLMSRFYDYKKIMHQYLENFRERVLEEGLG
ncbi:MAG: nucleotidyltransferase domain-containing protein [Euryarchaeota archaeon]|nr:nucleotidyltransferase domain-containing protein [Euryarchaeota archaeon]